LPVVNPSLYFERARKRRSGPSRRVHAWPALIFILFLIPQSFGCQGCDRSAKTAIGDLVIEGQAPPAWQRLDPGLEFARLAFTRKSSGAKVVVAALSVDPSSYRFAMIGAPDTLGSTRGFVHEMSARKSPVAAVNASFYLDESFEPIGLIVEQGKTINPWKPKAGSGVFWVGGGRARVEWARDFNNSWKGAELALQAGPLIVEPGGKPGIYNDSEKHRHRTALGLDADGGVVVVCTVRRGAAGEDLSGLDLYELMEVMMLAPKQGGLGLTAAMNLDGGVSSAMSIVHPKLRLEIRSAMPVANALAVYPRKPG